jgi:hypothetical protein
MWRVLGGEKFCILVEKHEGRRLHRRGDDDNHIMGFHVRMNLVQARASVGGVCV